MYKIFLLSRNFSATFSYTKIHGVYHIIVKKFDNECITYRRIWASGRLLRRQPVRLRSCWQGWIWIHFDPDRSADPVSSLCISHLPTHHPLHISDNQFVVPPSAIEAGCAVRFYHFLLRWKETSVMPGFLNPAGRVALLGKIEMSFLTLNKPK